ncbi:MAG: hypothetical protein K0S19_1629 [Geminicoccaceae bacterium]|nr:hypothetical protein [Geminicoccaceae bacterium]
MPEALGSEIRLPVPEATRRLADALKADSLPAQTVRLKDGYVETQWFNARTGQRASQRRSMGPGVVRVRAWVDPARPGSSQLTVETMYRPVADPSLPPRELERPVPADHRVARKVQAVLVRLGERYGAPPPAAAPAPAPAEPEQPY